MQKLLLALMCFMISVSFSDAQTISATALKNAAVGAFGKYQPTGASTATPGYGIPLKVGSDGGWLSSADPLPPAVATMTPTPTFTWNATTTRTQPPTPTATATNTPIMGQSQVRNVRQSENYSRSSYLIIPVLSPTPIVIPATTPGFYNKIELDVQTIGITWATLLFNSSTHNFGPFMPRNFYLFGDSNGPVTINISGNAAGVTTQVNVLSSVVRQGF